MSSCLRLSAKTFKFHCQVHLKCLSYRALFWINIFWTSSSSSASSSSMSLLEITHTTSWFVVPDAKPFAAASSCLALLAKPEKWRLCQLQAGLGLPPETMQSLLWALWNVWCKKHLNSKHWNRSRKWISLTATTTLLTTLRRVYKKIPAKKHWANFYRQPRAAWLAGKNKSDKAETCLLIFSWKRSAKFCYQPNTARLARIQKNTSSK